MFKTLSFLIVSVIIGSNILMADEAGNARYDAKGLGIIGGAYKMNGKINYAGDVDWYVFDIYSQDGEVHIYTTGSTDVEGRLEAYEDVSIYSQGSIGRTLVFTDSDDDSGSGTNFKFIHKTKYFGHYTRYFVGISHYDSRRTGSYTLHIQPGSTYRTVKKQGEERGESANTTVKAYCPVYYKAISGNCKIWDAGEEEYSSSKPGTLGSSSMTCRNPYSIGEDRYTEASVRCKIVTQN